MLKNLNSITPHNSHTQGGEGEEDVRENGISGLSLNLKKNTRVQGIAAKLLVLIHTS